MRIPFFGRFFDTFLLYQLVLVWLYVLEALAIVTIERVWRFSVLVIELLVPSAVLSWLASWAGGLVPTAAPWGRARRGPPELRYDAVQLIRARGYPCEEHFVKSRDGFLLSLHRIPFGGRAELESPRSDAEEWSELTAALAGPRARPAEPRRASSSPSARAPRPSVYLQHGFMQSSEAWLSTADNLPFMLADAGFDVWIGNARGNKYSCKHDSLSPDHPEYWNWSIDEAALIDIPAFIEYVLQVSGNDRLSYVGFSQGTAVGFAALSMNRALARKVNVMVAMGPALRVGGFANPLLDALCRSSPEIIYLLFGKKDLLPSTLFWQKHIGFEWFDRVIDRSCRFLFGWDMSNIREQDKPYHYAHIYSYSSVKTVVHWFQLLRAGRFQMYDAFRWRAHDQHMYSVPRFPTEQIKCPIVVFYGSKDYLPDTPGTIDLLPKSTVIVEVPTFEHVDFMYAHTARTSVYPRIVDLCRAAAQGNKPLHLHANHNRKRAPADDEDEEGDGDDDGGAVFGFKKT